MSIFERLLLLVVIPVVIILVGHLLSYTDLIDVKVLFTTVLWTFMIDFILEFFKNIPILRNRIFLYAYFTPYIVSIAVQLCIVELVASKESLSSICVFSSMILSLVWCQISHYFKNSTRNFRVFIRHLLHRKSQTILKCIVWIIIIFMFGGMFTYGWKHINSNHSSLGIKTIHDRYVSNFDTEFHGYEKDTIITKINETDRILSKKTYDGDGRSIFQFDKRFPLCRRKFTQFISEDTTFVCIWPIVLFDDRDYIAKWRLNGSDLLNKKTIIPTCNKSENSNAEILKFSSIEENDFGEYQLWISFNQMDSNTDKNTMTNYLIAQMFLFQAEDILTYAYVPVGNALYLKYFFPFENLFRDYYVSFEYRIESKLIGAISHVKQSQRFSNGCSVLTSIFYENQGEYMFYYDKYVYVDLCTPSISYGRHSIICNLTRLDKTLKSKQHVELASPMHYMVLPYKSLYISNASYDEYQAAQDIDNIDLSYEEMYLFLRNITEVFWLLTLNSSYILMCMLLLGTMNKMHLLLYSALHKFVFGYNVRVTQERRVEEPLYNNKHQKDVMIISTGDDNVFIQEIKSSLEKMRNEVCIPQWDFDAGQNELSLFSTAIKNSSSVIILCSQDFFNDPLLYDVVLSDIILQNKQILLIKRDGCDIPDFLQSKYIIIDAREIYIEEIETLKQIYEWMECRHPWYFRLTILGFVHYRIMLFLIMYTLITWVFFFNYGDDIRNKEYGVPVMLIFTLGMCFTFLIHLYIIFVCCFVVLISLCGCKCKYWKYYIRKRFTGRFIRHVLIFNSQDN